MKKKYVRFLSFTLGILVLVILVINFGINYWLQQNLSGYIKKNSAYQVNYEDLKVDFFTGDILVTAINIKNKNQNDLNTIGLQGSIDTLSVSRLGIYQALFNKRISSTDIFLANPDLTVRLAKPVDDKTGKKRNPVVFENLKIRRGNIAIFRHTQQKFLGVKSLDLSVENIQMTEESVENKLPLVFDRYDISGKNFFFRPDNVYAITAQNITTENGQMSVKQFSVVPLLSHRRFMAYYPKKKNLFELHTAEMNFRDLALDDNKIVLANAHFINPAIKIMTTDAKSAAQKKDFPFIINMEDVLLKNAKVSVIKPNGESSAAADDLTLNIQKFVMDAETTKAGLPFSYANFSIAGKNVGFSSENQKVQIAKVQLNPKKADFQSISVKPTNTGTVGTSLDFVLPRLTMQINEFKFIDKKLKADIQSITANNLKGSILAKEKRNTKKGNYDGIHFPLLIRNVEIKNSELTYQKENRPLVLNNLNLKIQNIELNEQTAKNAIPFKTGKYQITANGVNYQTKFYQITTGALRFNNNHLQIAGTTVKPSVSRAAFIRMIPTEKDLYDVKVSQITMNGKWDIFSNRQFIDASSVTLGSLKANIFRSKIPKDDTSEKSLYSRLLRSIKIPLYIKDLQVKDSYLEYEEDTKKSDGPGKLIFSNFNMTVQHLNSGKMKGRPTRVPIDITCRFMNASPMHVKWSFDTAAPNDDFTIAGNVADLPASRINPFIEPYLKIRATGQISDLIFNFKGNRNGLDGTLNMKHKDLKVSILREDGEKNKLLSAVANLIVRSDSGTYPESVVVDPVERNKTKSFFNLFWKGIEQGLKKTLIGKNAENTEKAVKNTMSGTKSAVAQGKENIKETAEDVKEKVQEKKEGLKNLFKKKSE